jgi:hypothetical protein
MSFKQFILITMILAICHSQLVFLQQNNEHANNGDNGHIAHANNGHNGIGKVLVDLGFTRQCNKYWEGECAALIPAAVGCAWAAGANHGWCIHKVDNKFSNVFILPSV